MRNQSNKPNPQTKAKVRASLTFRMNILFFCIFILFSVLIFRLGYLQIVKGEDYVRLLARTEEVRVNTSVPRGRIFDRNGRILVDNQPENAITYTRMQTTKTAEMIEVATQLAELIDQPTDRVTQRDKLDFWIMQNQEAAIAKVPQSEIQKMRAANEEIEESELNAKVDQLIRDRITEEELATLTEQDLEVLAIFREMSSGYYLSPQIVKNENVTAEEFARVSERLADLPGVNTTTDWKRVRLTSLAVLGRTTVPSKGIPKAKLDHYLARDYSRNDRVGESYFEASYEELLQGEKSVVKNITNKKGQVVETLTTYEGVPGKDLVSTIDIELQTEVEKIVEKYLLQMKASGASKLLDRAFVVMMNPNTGELLSVVGKKVERDSETGKLVVSDYSYGTFTTAYEAGSTVKAATVLTGYKEGVITPNTTMIDEPIYLIGDTKSSIFNRGSRIAMNEQSALERSSNVYMFKIAMAIGGLKYYPYMALNFKDNTLQTMRNSYAQFGLGVPTGVDLPGETIGFQGEMDTTAKILNLAIGQFDTYTPLQLAQYISTVANGGSRVQPHMLKEIRNPSEDGETLGTLVQEFETNVLNHIDNTEEEINYVKEGLRRVYFGGSGSAVKAFGSANYTAAGKTGTAEVDYYDVQREYWGTKTINLTHVGFAPFENPEIAYSVVIPWASTNLSTYTSFNNFIAREAVDKYFELQKKYAKAGILDEQVAQPILPAFTEDMLGEDEESEETAQTTPSE